MSQPEVRVYRFEPNKRYVVFVSADWASCREWDGGFSASVAKLAVVGETGAPIAVAAVWTDWGALLQWVKDILGAVVSVLSEVAGAKDVVEALKNYLVKHWKDIEKWLEDFAKAMSDIDEAWRRCVDKVALFTASGVSVMKKYSSVEQYARACATRLTPCMSRGTLWGVVAIQCDSKTCVAELPSGEKLVVGRAIYYVAEPTPFTCHGETHTLKAAMRVQEAGKWAFPAMWFATLGLAALGAGAATIYYAVKARRGGP